MRSSSSGVRQDVKSGKRRLQQTRVHLQRRTWRIAKDPKALVVGERQTSPNRVNPHIRDIFQYSGFDLIVEIELLPD